MTAKVCVHVLFVMNLWCVQVQDATGFAPGLFTPEEQDAANLKEKPAKVQYLDKIINTVGLALGVYCPVSVTMTLMVDD